jgi:hypothetical protein
MYALGGNDVAVAYEQLAVEESSGTYILNHTACTLHPTPYTLNPKP